MASIIGITEAYFTYSDRGLTDLETFAELQQRGLEVSADGINKSQLEEMLGAHPPIVRPSSSPWASDVLLVKKKDGSLRFAVDYRRLNRVTKRDEYSLPHPQSIFDKLRGSRYFSK